MTPQWTPEDTSLARRIVALGLPMPTFTPGDGGGSVSWQIAEDGWWEVDLYPGHVCRPFGIAPSAGLLFACAATDTGPELLPVLTDFALLGWITTEARRRLDEPHLRARWSKSGQRWEVYGDSAKWRNIVGQHAGVGPTEIEAYTVALEAAKAGA